MFRKKVLIWLLVVEPAELPEYVRNTHRLSAEAIRVRTTILAAKDPVTFLFPELPIARMAARHHPALAPIELEIGADL